ncbi:MAG TPA: DoxX family protein [Opitutaceae bacterium]|nr:DoxX family protein [Opitutaceae bacterium]
MTSLRESLRATTPAVPVFLVRLMVGAVFLSEGVQKFLFADQLGVGRFAKIGFPAPQLLAPFVGGCETVFGALVIVGFCTRLAAVPLLAVISTAITTTKLPMLMHDGFWKTAHEARTDYAMLLGLLFLLIVGGGGWSVDAQRRAPPPSA